MSESFAAKAERAIQEMCCEPHTIGVVCMRNPGHDGLHWAQHRWESFEAEKVRYDRVTSELLATEEAGT